MTMSSSVPPPLRAARRAFCSASCRAHVRLGPSNAASGWNLEHFCGPPARRMSDEHKRAMLLGAGARDARALCAASAARRAGSGIAHAPGKIAAAARCPRRPGCSAPLSCMAHIRGTGSCSGGPPHPAAAPRCSWAPARCGGALSAAGGRCGALGSQMCANCKSGSARAWQCAGSPRRRLLVGGAAPPCESACRGSLACSAASSPGWAVASGPAPAAASAAAPPETRSSSRSVPDPSLWSAIAPARDEGRCGAAGDRERRAPCRLRLAPRGKMPTCQMRAAGDGTRCVGPAQAPTATAHLGRGGAGTQGRLRRAEKLRARPRNPPTLPLLCSAAPAPFAGSTARRRSWRAGSRADAVPVRPARAHGRRTGATKLACHVIGGQTPAHGPCALALSLPGSAARGRRAADAGPAAHVARSKMCEPKRQKCVRARGSAARFCGGGAGRTQAACGCCGARPAAAASARMTSLASKPACGCGCGWN